MSHLEDVYRVPSQYLEVRFIQIFIHVVHVAIIDSGSFLIDHFVILTELNCLILIVMGVMMSLFLDTAKR